MCAIFSHSVAVNTTHYLWVDRTQFLIFKIGNQLTAFQTSDQSHMSLCIEYCPNLNWRIVFSTTCWCLSSIKKKCHGGFWRVSVGFWLPGNVRLHSRKWNWTFLFPSGFAAMFPYVVGYWIHAKGKHRSLFSKSEMLNLWQCFGVDITSII